MDVDTVLEAVKERDKWRRRLGVLENSLAELARRLSRAEGRLRRVRREIGRLQEYSDAILSARLPRADTGATNAPRNPQLPAR